MKNEVIAYHNNLSLLIKTIPADVASISNTTEEELLAIITRAKNLFLDSAERKKNMALGLDEQLCNHYREILNELRFDYFPGDLKKVNGIPSKDYNETKATSCGLSSASIVCVHDCSYSNRLPEPKFSVSFNGKRPSAFVTTFTNLHEYSRLYGCKSYLKLVDNLLRDTNSSSSINKFIRCLKDRVSLEVQKYFGITKRKATSKIKGNLSIVTIRGAEYSFNVSSWDIFNRHFLEKLFEVSGIHLLSNVKSACFTLEPSLFNHLMPSKKVSKKSVSLEGNFKILESRPLGRRSAYQLYLKDQQEHGIFMPRVASIKDNAFPVTARPEWQYHNDFFKKGWKELSEQEKEFYNIESEIDKGRHKIEMEKWQSVRKVEE